MLFLVCTLALLSASEALHKRLHADAGHADHHCVITTIAQGQIDHSPVDVVVVPPNFTAQIFAAPVTVALADAPFRLLPSRGPPALA